MKKRLLGLVPMLLLASCGASSSSAIPSFSSRADASPVDPGESSTLVAYFSATKNTKKLAEYAQEHLGGDIFEIVPKEAYTEEDINYRTDCRAKREQDDSSARPEIAYTVDLKQYDTIVLGYPIWFGEAPKILYTFMESYDFSGKTILPFCTSGSSPVGSSAENLAKSAPNATWLDGKRFGSNATKEEVGSWLDQYIKEDTMKFKVNEREVPVTWENNASVEALSGIKPLNIEAERYGGFEQVGPLGQSIISNDVQITTSPGDIVLYASNQIVAFFGSNTWRYTKLGHIDLSQSELRDLLDKPSVTLSIL